MDSFRETAIGFAVWYAFLALLGCVLLIVVSDLDAHAAFLAGADVALLFALGLILKLRSLNERSFVRCEVWRALPAAARPSGERGRRMAFLTLERIWLHSAKGAAAIAIVLCGLALASHHADTAASAHSLATSDLISE